MKRKYLVPLLIIGLFLFPSLAGCSLQAPADLSAKTQVSDTTQRPLPVVVTTAKASIPFAQERVKEWQPASFIEHTLVIELNGKENIETGKGIIYYHFSSFIPDLSQIVGGEITIDMNKNCITNFQSNGIDPRTQKHKFSEKDFQVAKTDREIQAEDWAIDIHQAAALVIKAFGEKDFNNYQTPRIVILCTKTQWEVILYSDTNPDVTTNKPLAHINIDPKTAQITAVH